MLESERRIAQETADTESSEPSGSQEMKTECNDEEQVDEDVGLLMDSGEAMRHMSQNAQGGADSVSERKEPDASMERKRSMLRKMLKALTDERLSRPVEQVVRRGRWTLRVQLEANFTAGKRNIFRRSLRCVAFS